MLVNMLHIGICIPSRNRPSALYECLESVLLSLRTVSSQQARFTIYIRDNSDQVDDNLADNIRSRSSLFGPLTISYVSNGIPCHMSDNWNLLAQDALSDSCDYVIFLADRRLLTPSVFRLVDLIHTSQPDVIVFDHQSWWLSSSNLIRTRNYNTPTPVEYPSYERFRDVRHVIFDGLTPRLYNCITSARLLRQFNEWYGSYVGGPFPDINFQFRLSFDVNSLCLRTSIPVIACNARHACLTSSSSGKPNSTSLDLYHCRKSPASLGFADEFIFAQCISHLSEAVCDRLPTSEALAKWFSPDSLFKSALWELSCPMTLTRFMMLRENLIRLLSDASHPLASRLGPTNTANFLTLVRQIPHVSEIHQHQPLEYDSMPLSNASFSQLLKIT